jgi:hypothetical protein
LQGFGIGAHAGPVKNQFGSMVAIFTKKQMFFHQPDGLTRLTCRMIGVKLMWKY